MYPSVLQHDAWSCDENGGGLPFPTPRIGGECVGAVFELPSSTESRKRDKVMMQNYFKTQNHCCKEERYTFVTADFRSDVIDSFRSVITQFGVDVKHIDINTCKEHSLSVQSALRGVDSSMRAKFAQCRGQIQFADAFVCTYPASLCEYVPTFQGVKIVIASNRYDAGRQGSKQDLQAWTKSLLEIANKDYNVVAATNVYDAKYIEHYTGLKNVPVVPSFPTIIDAETYTASERSEVILGPWASPQEGLDALYAAVRSAASHTLKKASWNWDRTAPQSNSKTRAIVHVPREMSSTRFFQDYASGVPIFCPSQKMLLQLEAQHHVLSNKAFAHGSVASEPLTAWLRYADYYQWPHVTLYDSWEDLVLKLDQDDDYFQKTSAAMTSFTFTMRAQLLAEWAKILRGVRLVKSGNQHGRVENSCSNKRTFLDAFKKPPR